MKILLISPRSSFLGRNSEFIKFFNQSPEMEFYRQYWSGLGTGLLIVGALIPYSVDLELIDENVEEIDFKKKYDLVFITAMTQQVNRAYDIAKNFRSRNIKVVLGGIHATILPEEASANSDSVVVGEVENVWPQIWDDFKHNKLKRIYSSKEIVDLKHSPVPRYELLKGKPYKMLWVQATRGCPHDCCFCCASKVYGPKYRHKLLDQVVNEIAEIRKINKHAVIGFSDDNLFCNKDYSRKLLKRITQLKIKWFGQSDISIADDIDLLRAIKKSGCIALAIGFESIKRDNLQGLDSSDWKMKQSDNYVRNIKTIQTNGIGIIGTFIAGFDSDNSSTFQELADFIINNHLAGAQIAALTPLPGTRIREQFISEDRVLDTPWKNYTFYDVNIKPAGMSAQELEKGILYVFKKVYSPEVAIGKAKYFKDIFHNINQRSN